MGEVENLGSSAFPFAKNTIFKILSRILLDAVFGLGQKVLASPENDSLGGAYGRAGGLLSGSQALLAEFTFHNLGIESLPLEFGDVVRACDFAVAAADAKFRVPGHDSGLGVFLEPFEHAAGDASGIDAMDALLLDVRIRL